MKRMLKAFVVGLVLTMAVTFSVSAATAQVELTKRMYYVSGSHLSFSAAQAQYRGTIYPDSTCECKIYLFAKTANGNREISSRVLTPGSSVFSSPWYGRITHLTIMQQHGIPMHSRTTAEAAVRAGTVR